MELEKLLYYTHLKVVACRAMAVSIQTLAEILGPQVTPIVLSALSNN